MSRPTVGRLLFAGLILLLTTGCRLTQSPTAVPCPLPLGEQQRAVEELLAEGQSRDDALRKLTDAGLTGRFGTTESIYYLETWSRPAGEEWLMEVAVLFDGDGRFVRVRAADAAAVTGGQTSEASPATQDETAQRNDRRTPFAEE